MWRHRPNRIAFVGLVAFAAVAARADGAEAQVVGRAGQASVRVAASLVIPARLVLEPAGPGRVVSREGDQVEVDLPFQAGANLHWSATVGLRDSEGAAPGEVSVLLAEGLWVRIRPGQSVQLTGRREPSDPSPLVVRVRYRGTAARPGEHLVFTIQAAN